MSSAISRRDIVRVVTQRLIDEPRDRQLWVERLAAYIISHKLIDEADLLVNDIAHELHRQTGLLTVEVVSARQLTEAVRQSLRDMLQRETGAQTKRVVLHETTDQTLLGGFVARTPDAEIDASIQTKLKKLSSLT